MILEEHLWLVAPGLTFGALLVATVWLFLRKQRVVALLVGTVSLLLLATAAPSLRPARPVAQRNACIANLQAMEKAKTTWAASVHATNGAGVTWENLVGTNAPLRHLPRCPAGGSYSLGLVGQVPSCDLDHKGHQFTPAAEERL